ncbi:hypothetical protein [Halosimplex sp. J119]
MSEKIASLFDFSVKIADVNREMSEVCRIAVESYHRGSGKFIEEYRYPLYRAAIDAYEMGYNDHADDIYSIVMEETSLDPELPHPRNLKSY